MDKRQCGYSLEIATLPFYILTKNVDKIINRHPNKGYTEKNDE
ncbi:hypothetical protein GCM10008022_18890 [Paenibacillus hunanensis]|nr:hypothetical protein GCM10008022_18890 [Paenibacillus hunanensis]